jgi:hypothetical protein
MKGYLIDFNYYDIATMEFHKAYYWAYDNKTLTARRQLIEKAFFWKDNNEKVRGGKFHKWLSIPASYTIHVVEL